MLDQIGVGDTFKGMEEQAKRNMTMFNEAMKMFNPFANAMGGAAQPESPKPAASQPASSDELATLKEHMAAMQKKLDTISK